MVYEASIRFRFEPHSKCYDAAQPQPLNLTNATFCIFLPPDQWRANPFICLDAGRRTHCVRSHRSELSLGEL